MRLEGAEDAVHDLSDTIHAGKWYLALQKLLMAIKL